MTNAASQVVNDVPLDTTEHTSDDLTYDTASVKYSPTSGLIERPSVLCYAITNALLGITAITAPLVYFDPRQEFGHTTSSEIQLAAARRPGRQVTLAEARGIALRVLEQAEQELLEERKSEANVGSYVEE